MYSGDNYTYSKMKVCQKSWHALLKYFSKSNILLITDMFHHNLSPFYLNLFHYNFG